MPIGNLFNSGDGLQALGLMFSAGSNDPSRFGNMFNLVNNLDEQDRKKREESKKEQASLNFLNKAGLMNAPIGGELSTAPDGTAVRIGANTQAAPELSDQFFGNFTPQTDTSQIDLMKAVGPENLLNSRITEMSPKYEKVGEDLFNLHAPGGPKKVATGTAPMSDYAKDLVASGLAPGSPEFNKAMSSHREKQDFIPSQSPSEIALREAQTDAARARADADRGKATLLNDIPEGATGKDVLDLLNPIERAQVEGIVSGAQQMPRATANPKAQRVAGLVQLVDPSYTGARYTTNQDYRPGGKAGQNLVAANTAISHLASMAEAAKGLGNVGTPIVGKAYNFAQQGVKSSGSNPALKAFNTAKENAASELVKLFRGTGGDAHSVQEWRNNFSHLSSPEEIKAATDEALSLLQGRVDSMAYGYNSVMSTNKAPEEFISPQAREQVAKLHGGGDTQPQGAPAAPAAPTAPQLPPGMVRQVGTYQGKPVFIDAQGQRHVAN